MGCIINHAKTTKIVPSRIPTKLNKECKAMYITEVLPSGVWRGKRCIIIGGGPSLENFNFSVLNSELTIGVNKAFIVHNSTVNYAMDLRFYSSLTEPSKKDPKAVELHQQWLNYKGIKLFLRTSKKVKFGPSVYYVNSLRRKVLSFNLNEGIHGGNNSGFGALMLAIALGANPIGLLGFDLKVNKKKNRTHWHEGYFHQNVHEMPRKLESFAKCFEEFAPTIEQHKIKVVNLCLDSALRCFPKSTPKEFLEGK